MNQVHVELTRLHESQRLHFKATFPPREGSWNLQLPTWRPGRYELGNFAQYVMWVEGIDDQGKRMRLSKSQNIVAVAEMSDGSVYMAKSPVKVTIGGCGG